MPHLSVPRPPSGSYLKESTRMALHTSWGNNSPGPQDSLWPVAGAVHRRGASSPRPGLGFCPCVLWSHAEGMVPFTDPKSAPQHQAQPTGASSELAPRKLPLLTAVPGSLSLRESLLLVLVSCTFSPLHPKVLLGIHVTQKSLSCLF